MSEIEFEKRFNTEQACMDYLAKMKWPERFCGQRCGHQEHWISANLPQKTTAMTRSSRPKRLIKTLFYLVFTGSPRWLKD